MSNKVFIDINKQGQITVEGKPVTGGKDFINKLCKAMGIGDTSIIKYSPAMYSPEKYTNDSNVILLAKQITNK